MYNNVTIVFIRPSKFILIKIIWSVHSFQVRKKSAVRRLHSKSLISSSCCICDYFRKFFANSDTLSIKVLKYLNCPLSTGLANKKLKIALSIVWFGTRNLITFFYLVMARGSNLSYSRIFPDSHIIKRTIKIASSQPFMKHFFQIDVYK